MHSVGNDPWHNKTFTTSVEATFSASSIIEAISFQKPIPATFGTRCTFASVENWNEKRVQWLNGEAFGGGSDGGRPHQKEIVGLLEVPSSGAYQGIGLKSGTGGTKNCSATLFSCGGSVRGFGQDGKNFFGGLF